MNNIPFAKQANFIYYLDFYQKCLSMRDEIPLLYRFFDSRRLLNNTHVLSVLLCLIHFISKMPGIGEDWINNPLGIIQHIIGKKKYISKQN